VHYLSAAPRIIIIIIIIIVIIIIIIKLDYLLEWLCLLALGSSFH